MSARGIVLAFLLMWSAAFPLNHAFARFSSDLPQGFYGGDTSYVEILPPFGGFGNPRAVIVGTDQLLYVADYDHNELLMLDPVGTLLGRRQILHPTSVAQNSKFDLYVGGRSLIRNDIDTTAFDTVAAIYKINLVRFDTTYVARIDTVISVFGDTALVPVLRDTSYFYDHDLGQAHGRTIWNESRQKPNRQHVGLGILPNDGFLVARNGPDNTSLLDPDTRVLLFDSTDRIVTPVMDLVTCSSGCTAITDISYLTNMAVIPSTSDFIVTQNSLGGVPFGATWMRFQRTPYFQGWLPRFNPSYPGQDTIDFIQPNRFVDAAAVTVDPRRKEIFIVDAAQDSVMKFDWNGRFLRESFGKALTRSDLLPGLSRPDGVAVLDDGTVYIADAGNKIIRRFRLAGGVTGVRETGDLPISFSLDQNFPNPFNPQTSIAFSIPVPADVSLKVYNLLGEEVAQLVSGPLSAGTYKRTWNAAGRPSGIYFYRLAAGRYAETKKLILLR